MEGWQHALIENSHADTTQQPQYFHSYNAAPLMFSSTQNVGNYYNGVEYTTIAAPNATYTATYDDPVVTTVVNDYGTNTAFFNSPQNTVYSSSVLDGIGYSESDIMKMDNKFLTTNAIVTNNSVIQNNYAQPQAYFADGTACNSTPTSSSAAVLTQEQGLQSTLPVLGQEQALPAQVQQPQPHTLESVISASNISPFDASAVITCPSPVIPTASNSLQTSIARHLGHDSVIQSVVKDPMVPSGNDNGIIQISRSSKHTSNGESDRPDIKRPRLDEEVELPRLPDGGKIPLDSAVIQVSSSSIENSNSMQPEQPPPPPRIPAAFPNVPSRKPKLPKHVIHAMMNSMKRTQKKSGKPPQLTSIFKRCSEDSDSDSDSDSESELSDFDSSSDLNSSDDSMIGERELPASMMKNLSSLGSDTDSEGGLSPETMSAENSDADLSNVNHDFSEKMLRDGKWENFDSDKEDGMLDEMGRKIRGRGRSRGRPRGSRGAATTSRGIPVRRVGRGSRGTRRTRPRGRGRGRGVQSDFDIFAYMEGNGELNDEDFDNFSNDLKSVASVADISSKETDDSLKQELEVEDNEDEDKPLSDPPTMEKVVEWLQRLDELLRDKTEDADGKTEAMPQPCLFCGKMCKDKVALKVHLRDHTGEKPHKCKQCGSRFMRATELKEHVSVHENPKPYKCTICAKGFRQMRSLKRHQQIHEESEHLANHKVKIEDDPELKENPSSKEPPTTPNEKQEVDDVFECDICGKCFKFSSYLRRHKMLHSGDRPYKCPECGKGFTQNGNLKTHMRLHTGEKPYHCKSCGEKFLYPRQYQNHSCTAIDENIPDDLDLSVDSLLDLSRDEETGTDLILNDKDDLSSAFSNGASSQNSVPNQNT